MATGKSKKGGLGRGLGALITRTDEGAPNAPAATSSVEGGPGPNNSAVGSAPLGNLPASEQPVDEPVAAESSADDRTSAETIGSGGVLRIPVAAISPNPHQPRAHFDDGALEELATSVQEHGIIQPLIVTQAQDAKPGQPVYWLIAGERRWRAAQRAGLSMVPVIVREASARQLMELALIENIQREDLNPLEEATAYQALMDEYSLTQAELAERVGKSRSAVANSVRLLHLSPAVQEALLAKKIASGHARTLLGLIDDDKMDLALQEVIARQLSVRQTETLVKELLEAEDAAYAAPVLDSEDPLASHWRGLEDRFRNALGTKVSLNRNADGAGRLVVHFYNDDDLDSLLRQIAGDDDLV